MNTKINAQTILIVLMLCVTVIVSTNSYANAQGGGENDILLGNVPESEIMLDPVEGGPGFIMVSTFDFRPYRLIDEWEYWGASLTNPSKVEDSYMEAGVTLPHGATITKVTLYYTDSFAGDMTLKLWRAGTGGSVIRLATATSVGAQAEPRFVSQTNITEPIVDNQNFSYSLEIMIPKNSEVNLLLTNVRIDYEYPGYLPCVQK